jgi:uncharacterized protein YejL (UPF0352 family)
MLRMKDVGSVDMNHHTVCIALSVAVAPNMVTGIYNTDVVTSFCEFTSDYCTAESGTRDSNVGHYTLSFWN